MRNKTEAKRVNSARKVSTCCVATDTLGEVLLMDQGNEQGAQGLLLDRRAIVNQLRHHGLSTGAVEA